MSYKRGQLRSPLLAWRRLGVSSTQGKPQSMLLLPFPQCPIVMVSPSKWSFRVKVTLSDTQPTFLTLQRDFPDGQYLVLASDGENPFYSFSYDRPSWEDRGLESAVA